MIPNRNSLKILLEIPIKILRIGKSNAIFSEFYNIFFFYPIDIEYQKH